MESNKPKVTFSSDIAPTPNDNQPLGEIKFSRRKDHHKTVNQGAFNMKGLQSHIKQIQNAQVLNTIKEEVAKEKFVRKGNRSISLIEKNKLGSSIFKEELKLKVTINTLIEETNGLPTMKYKVIQKLGDGAYGTVYLAINLMTKAKVAMKKINKVKENEIDDMEIKNEINILKKLDHPNIVKILEFYSTPKAYYIITSFFLFL